MIRTKFPLRRLDSRGVSHLVLPLAVVMLLAIGGTFMLVAKRSNTVDLSSATTAAGVATGKKGRVLVYSQGGTYSKVKISVVNPVGKKTYACGGSLSSQGASAIQNLRNKVTANDKTSYPATTLNCTATTGGSSYEFDFGKVTNPLDKYVTFGTKVPVDVQAGYCTLVHADAAKIRKVPFKNGHCEGDLSKEDPIVPLDTTLTVRPQLAKSKKAINGYVEVKAFSTDLKTADKCSGNVDITLTSSNADPAQVPPSSRPLKLVRNKKNNHNIGYCVAVINQTVPQGSTAQDWTVSANFKGSIYLKSSSGQATITVPAKTVKATGASAQATPKKN